jgi:hypothetical protein
MPKVWALMDALDPSDEEKQTVGHMREITDGGAEKEAWNVRKGDADDTAIDVNIHRANVARIQAAIKSFPQAGNDRRWIMTLLEKFTPELLDEEGDE